MRAKIPEWDDAVVFRVAQLFLGQPGDGRSAADIARQVSDEFPRAAGLTRETVYPVVAEAVRRGFLQLVPPVDLQLAEKVTAKYPCLRSSVLRVVETAGPRDNAKVAAVAAALALEHLEEIVAAKQASLVGVGLGPGRATLDFCRAFRDLLQGYPDPVRLKLVAIAAGCPADAPEYSPTSFFNLFPPHLVESRVGMFAETLVSPKAFREIQQRAGVKEAYAAAESIDLVVTSIGDAKDEHDLLTMCLKQSGGNPGRMRADGWVGHVQYRPYSVAGPMREKPGELRAVTLFELEDLVRMAGQKHRQVILMARQCASCGRTRAAALRPLLTNAGLRVFSTLVLDAATARELLE
jgi:DNA-binding transcriptional regulator LsrR (DeoR family)